MQAAPLPQGIGHRATADHEQAHVIAAPEEDLQRLAQVVEALLRREAPHVADHPAAQSQLPAQFRAIERPEQLGVHEVRDHHDPSRGVLRAQHLRDLIGGRQRQRRALKHRTLHL